MSPRVEFYEFYYQSIIWAKSSALLSFLSSGLNFLIDQNKTHESIQLSRDLKCARANTSEEMQTAYADITLSHGVHFWKARIDKIVTKNSSKGYISFGVTTEGNF